MRVQGAHLTDTCWCKTEETCKQNCSEKLPTLLNAHSPSAWLGEGVYLLTWCLQPFSLVTLFRTCFLKDFTDILSCMYARGIMGKPGLTDMIVVVCMPLWNMHAKRLICKMDLRNDMPCRYSHSSFIYKSALVLRRKCRLNRCISGSVKKWKSYKGTYSGSEQDSLLGKRKRHVCILLQTRP